MYNNGGMMLFEWVFFNNIKELHCYWGFQNVIVAFYFCLCRLSLG